MSVSTVWYFDDAEAKQTQALRAVPSDALPAAVLCCSVLGAQFICDTTPETLRASHLSRQAELIQCWNQARATILSMPRGVGGER